MQLKMLLGNPDCVCVYACVRAFPRVCALNQKKVACSACTEHSVVTVTTGLAVGHEDSERIVGP